MKKRGISTFFVEQGVPLVLTSIVFFFFSTVLYLLILLLNTSGSKHILTVIRFADVLVGMTIYLKTSVDFAIFIGNLMVAYPGWKNRIAIEVGTAAGNALGTCIILTIWNYFREVRWLLGIMIVVAALVLFKLAEDGLAHTKDKGVRVSPTLHAIANKFGLFLSGINRATHPILRLILPNLTMMPEVNKSWMGLFVTSLSVPFILGLDDFAGYVPVFNIVNVFGFSLGVLAGHMVLNIFLFLSPQKTIRVVKNPLISFLGSVAFVGLALWGIYEAIHLFI